MEINDETKKLRRAIQINYRMVAVIIVELLVGQSEFSFWQRNIAVFDRNFEEWMNAELNLHNRQVFQQRPLMIWTWRFFSISVQDVPATWWTIS